MIIVQFGGRPFSTASLTLEQWAWCIFFGVGVLVWGQLITTIPTKRIPKQFSWGSGPPEEIMDATSSLVEDGSSGSLSQDVKRTGQILWIRGLTRLQTQVCLIQLHNSTVSQQLSLKRASIGSPTSPTTSTGVAAVTGGTAAAGAIAGALAAAAAAAASTAGSGGSTASTTTTATGTITIEQQHHSHHQHHHHQQQHYSPQLASTVEESLDNMAKPQADNQSDQETIGQQSDSDIDTQQSQQQQQPQKSGVITTTTTTIITTKTHPQQQQQQRQNSKTMLDNIVMVDAANEQVKTKTSSKHNRNSDVQKPIVINDDPLGIGKATTTLITTSDQGTGIGILPSSSSTVTATTAAAVAIAPPLIPEQKHHQKHSTKSSSINLDDKNPSSSSTTTKKQSKTNSDTLLMMMTTTKVDDDNDKNPNHDDDNVR